MQLAFIWVIVCFWIIHVTKKIQIFYGQEYVLIYLKQLQSFWVVYVKAQIKSKMIYSESESDFNFAINSVSDFDSTSKSASDDSESDFSSVFMNLDICIFFTLHLHSSKNTCGWFFQSILITE